MGRSIAIKISDENIVDAYFIEDMMANIEPSLLFSAEVGREDEISYKTGLEHAPCFIRTQR